MKLDRTAAGLALTALAVLHMPSVGHVLRFGPPTALADQDGNGGEGRGGGQGNQGGNGSGGGSGNGGSGGNGGEGGQGGQGGQGGDHGVGQGLGGEQGSGGDDDEDDDGTGVAGVPVGAAPEPAFAQPEDRGDIVPDEILVAVDARDVLPSGLLASGFRVVETRNLPALDLSITRLSLPRGLTPEAARTLLLERYPDLLVDVHNLYRPAAVLADCLGPVEVDVIATALDEVAGAGTGERCSRISRIPAA